MNLKISRRRSCKLSAEVNRVIGTITYICTSVHTHTYIIVGVIFTGYVVFKWDIYIYIYSLNSLLLKILLHARVFR